MGYGVDEQGAPLSIGLFETNQQLQALLHDLLSLAGHYIITCDKNGQSLAMFLDNMVEQIKCTGIAPYDLFILNVAATELVGNARTSLEYLTLMQTLPVILLTDPTELEPFQSNVTVIPVLFHSLLKFEDLFVAIESVTGTPLQLSKPLLRLVLLKQREHHQRLVETEQGWIDQRQEWATQRQQWFEQRSWWLRGRLGWLNSQRKRPYPQHEWLDEQQQWVQQQVEELRLQQQWLLDRQHWLSAYQKRLYLMKQQSQFSDYRQAL